MKTHYFIRSGLKCMVALVTGLLCAKAIAQDPVFNPQNGHFYVSISVEDVISWEEAKSAAESLLLYGVPGHLATLTTQQEQDYVAATFPEALAGGFWLGGIQAPGQLDPAAGWSWITRETWDFTHWLPGGEPNDFGGVDENVLAFHGFLGPNPDGFWNDGQPWTAAGYVVEWENVDSDGDGIPDAEDACPHSDLNTTVSIAGCDTGVPNALLQQGCTLADQIAECATTAASHDAFVSCVAHLTNALRKSGVINQNQKSRIQRCAAQSDLP